MALRGSRFLPALFCWWAFDVPCYADAPTVVGFRQSQVTVDLGPLFVLTEFQDYGRVGAGIQDLAKKQAPKGPS